MQDDSDPPRPAPPEELSATIRKEVEPDVLQALLENADAAAGNLSPPHKGRVADRTHVVREKESS